MIMRFGGQQCQRASGKTGAPGGKSWLAQKGFQGSSLYPWGPQSFCLLRPPLMHESHIMEHSLQSSKTIDLNVTCP